MPESPKKNTAAYDFSHPWPCRPFVLAFSLWVALCWAGASIPTTERTALIALYESTGGDQWDDHHGWKTPPLHADGFALPGTEDGWFGVTVESDHVIQVGLIANNLSGTIPAVLSNLGALQYLFLSENHLEGSIPAELGNLASLQYLMLNSNRLGGDIPPQLGELKNLRSLWLSDNRLCGTIPLELGSLTSLQELLLSQNLLAGNIPPALGGLTNLAFLSLDNNQFDGDIPAELAGLAKLQLLELDNNLLSGHIPTALGSLANLEVLSLSFNQLCGAIPPEVGSLINLRLLGLNDNQFANNIPPELGSLANLQYLWLNDNQLSGNIPSTLGSLKQCQILGLYSNQLEGNIPAELGNLTGLTILSLSYNQLTGNVPAELGDLGSLQSLELSGNQLSGPIPPELGRLTNLAGLHLSGNQLSGSIPSALGDLANLRSLDLAGNLLSGSLPPELGGLANLQYVSLNSNQLSGSIPSALGSLANLKSIWLQDNQLSGDIPSALGGLTNLRTLGLARNRLSGNIPPELGNLANLQDLWLASNQLSGSMPPDLGKLVNLSANTSDLRWNALYTDNTALHTFLDRIQVGSDWESTQTVAPANLTAGSPTTSSLIVSWTPIPYADGAGGYGVHFATSPGGPYTLFDTTGDKRASSMAITGLAPDTPYFFRVQTFTATHANNQNAVASEFSAPASGTTKVCTKPTIVQHPDDTGYCPGSYGFLFIFASGSEPLHYQWYKGLSGDTTNPVGEDRNDFSESSLSTTSSFWVRVSNDCGQADSRAAVITPGKGTNILTEPADTVVRHGASATFSVAAAGERLLYRWYEGESGDTSHGTNVWDANLIVGPVEKTRRFWVKVWGGCGSQNSRTAVVTTVEPDGDLNEDGTTDALDLQSLASYLADVSACGATYPFAGDINHDDLLNSLDLVLLMRALSE